MGILMFVMLMSDTAIAAISIAVITLVPLILLILLSESPFHD